MVTNHILSVSGNAIGAMLPVSDVCNRDPLDDLYEGILVSL